MKLSSFYPWLNSTILLTVFTTNMVFLSGCSTPDRYKPFEKEFNEPMPTKYEAPFNETRETYINDPSSNTGIPKEVRVNPEVIEPDPYLPGSSTVMYGIPIKGKTGFVLSPYAPDKGFVDVRGFPVDSDVRDPYTGKIMKVPVPVEPEQSPKQRNSINAEDLSTPAQQTPELTNELPPSPPVLEP